MPTDLPHPTKTTCCSLRNDLVSYFPSQCVCCGALTIHCFAQFELVFVLDAYDELSPVARFRNLWRTNNLERFRWSQDHAAGRQPEDWLAFPKVIITSRSELLTGQESHVESFVPLEGNNPMKDEARGAQQFLQEYRLLSFQDKRDEYIRQFVAVRWRRAFFKQVHARPRTRRFTQQQLTAALWECCISPQTSTVMSRGADDKGPQDAENGDVKGRGAGEDVTSAALRTAAATVAGGLPLLKVCVDSVDTTHKQIRFKV